MLKICDIAKGANVEGYYLAKSGNIKTSSNGKKYGDYILADSSGEINAKLWDVVDENECPFTGDILKVKGLVTEWQ